PLRVDQRHARRREVAVEDDAAGYLQRPDTVWLWVVAAPQIRDSGRGRDHPKTTDETEMTSHLHALLPSLVHCPYRGSKIAAPASSLAPMGAYASARNTVRPGSAQPSTSSRRVPVRFAALAVIRTRPRGQATVTPQPTRRRDRRSTRFAGSA